MESENTMRSGFDGNSKALILYLLLLPLVDRFVCAIIALSIGRDFLSANGGYIVMLFPGIAGLIASRVNRKQLPGLGVKRCQARFLAAGILISACYLLPAYIINWMRSPNIGFHDLQIPKMLIVTLPLDIIFAFGEELGWRGFFTPAMTAKFGYVKASIIIGVIWGLWHGTPVLQAYGPNGPFIFLVNTISLSFIMGYLRLRSKSVWPAVLLHALHNHLSSFFYVLSFGALDDYPQGEPSMLIVCMQALTAVIFLFLRRKELKRCLESLSFNMQRIRHVG